MNIENLIPLLIEQRILTASGGGKQAKVKPKRPKWADVYHGYPKLDPGKPTERDLPASNVFQSIFTKDYYLKNVSTFSNACATRVSLSLLHANINVKKEYQIQIGAYKGKGIITSAANMGKWLKDKLFGAPDEEIENPKSFNEVSSKIGKRKGIYILISNDFRWASGHATLWHDGNAIGGHNYYEHAKVIYFWELK